MNDIIQALIIALVPVTIELLTGIGKAIADWLKAKIHANWADRFVADLSAIAASLQRRFVAEWKAASADGKITEDEKKKLKAIFSEEVSKALAIYPKALTGYLKDMADHWLEEWLLRRAENPSSPVEESSEILSPDEQKLRDTEASQ